MAKQEPPPPSFEESLSELEATVKQLESGDLPLEKALEYFEKGVALSEQCRRQLEEAESKVEILLKKKDKVEAAPFPAETDKA